jgi:hypothetical protein
MKYNESCWIKYYIFYFFALQVIESAPVRWRKRSKKYWITTLYEELIQEFIYSGSDFGIPVHSDVYIKSHECLLDWFSHVHYTCNIYGNINTCPLSLLLFRGLCRHLQDMLVFGPVFSTNINKIVTNPETVSAHLFILVAQSDYKCALINSVNNNIKSPSIYLPKTRIWRVCNK